MTTLFDQGPDHDDVLATLRQHVDEWRGFTLKPAVDPYEMAGRYEPAAEGDRPLTETTRALLEHWFRPEPHEMPGAQGVRYFKYWPHQRQAVETFVYLHEVRGVRRAEDFWKFAGAAPEWSQRDPWPKLGAQLATGAGKTKVMSLLVAWAYLNAVREQASALGLGRHMLVVAPGLFVRDRLLQDFKPGKGVPSVFETDPVVPPALASDWHLNVYSPADCPRLLDPAEGALVVTNYHQLLRRTDVARADLPPGRKQISILFEEDDPSKLETVDVPLMDRFRRSRGVLVINDEAHHVWDEPGHLAFEERAKSAKSGAKADESAERAMAWIGALKRLHAASGSNGRVGLQVDLSATLFQEAGTTKTAAKGPKGATVKFRAAPLFRHAAMRYDLATAIAEGIVKRPVLERVKAVKKATGEPEPLVFDGAPNAWEKYKHLLASGIQRWIKVRDEMAAEGGRKPILFVLCADRSEAAEVASFLRYGIASREELTGQPLRGYKDPDTGEVLFVRQGAHGALESTVAEVHIGAREQSNEKEWEKIRASVNLIDRDEVPDPSGALDAFGRPAMVPNPYNVVVSVMMLKEGWDVRNVKVIVPLRTCDSRTLTEQILGRGLRKMHPPEVNEEGAAVLDPERLFVIQHPSFAAILKEIEDIVEEADPEDIHHAPEYVPVEQRTDAGATSCDVRMVRYEGQIEVVHDWRDTVHVPALPALAPRRGWRGEFDETEITTHLQEVQKAGEEFGLSFVLPAHPTYRDFDHVIEAVYVLPLLKKLRKSHHHKNSVKSVAREYLEQRTFDLPLGLPISFEKAIEQGAGRVAMANLARRDVSTRVVDALYPVLSEAMGRRLPTTQPLLTVLRASEVASYQAVKKHVYEGPALSVFTRAAMDSGDEVRVARLLDKAEDVLGWAYNHARVGYAIDYEWEGRPAKYIPDFVARAKLGAVEHHVLIEVKGRFDDRDKAKARRGLEYARLLTAADGRPWHYVFLLENPPRKDISWWEVQSVTRLADLLRRHELLPLFPIKGASAQTIELALVPQAPETDRYVRALPVFDLVAAAGDFGNSQAPEPLGWLPLSIELPLDRQCFVAKMQGDSMETPDGGVPNGAWVMFRRYGTNVPSVGALDGRRLLLELRDATDPENGGRYTVKRLRITAVDGEGAVQAVELRPDNPARSPIAVGVDDGALRVVAELVRVLG